MRALRSYLLATGRLFTGAVALAIPSISAAQVPAIMTAAVPPEGSTGYLLTAAIAKAITDNTPIQKITLQTFGGAASWPARMQTGEVNFGSHCGFKQVEEAYFGRGPFAKIGRQKNVRNMITGHGLPFSMSVVDPRVTTFQDLKGKSIFVVMVNQDQKTATEIVARVAGLEVGKSLRVISVRSPQEAIQGMLTGRGEGFFFGAIPALAEVKQARGMHSVSLSDEMIDAVIKADPVWGRTTIQPGTPPLKPETPVHTLEIMCGLAAGAQTSSEAVYLATKAIFEHRDEWRKAHPLGDKWTLKRAVQVMNAPYHDGAVRYYKEKGVWTEAHERKQQEMLAQ